MPNDPPKKPKRRRRRRKKKSQQLEEVRDKTDEKVSKIKVKTVTQPCAKAVVQPSVTLVKEGWFDDKKADHFVPATIKVSLAETTSGLATTTYTGDGTVAVGDLDVYTEETCTTKLTVKVGNAALRLGKPLYVKGTAVGQETATLTLDAAQDAGKVTVKGPTSETTPFKKVNVITPKIELQSKVVLLNCAKPVNGKKTSVCWLKLQLEQTNKAHKCNALKAKLVYGGEVEGFKKQACSQALASGSELTYKELTGRNPKKLYLRGKAEGELKISLEPVLPKDLAKSFRVEAKKEETLAVVKIEVMVYAWAAGRNYTKQNDGTYYLTPEGKAGNGRKLHYQNGDKSFKRAKVTVKKPDALLWKHGTDDAKITLTPSASGGARLRFYTSAGGNTRVTALKKAALGGDKELWIEATGTIALDADPKYKKGGWVLKSPVKQSIACFVHFGAKVKAPDGGSSVDLNYGDGAKIETFSFDRHLDRQTRNDSHLKIRSTQSYDLDDFYVALAHAGLHRGYGTFFGPCMNLNYSVNGSPVFGWIRGSLNRRYKKESNASRAKRATDNVKKHLKTHKVVLHSVTWRMIYAYFLSQFDGSGNTRLEARWGVPGVHAEVLAVNEALRHLTANGENPTYSTATLGAISVATYKLQWSSRFGRRFPACPNCTGILNQKGLRVITGIR